MPSSLVFCVAAATDLSAKANDPNPDYPRDIRPILAENCFQCHETPRSGPLHTSTHLELSTSWRRRMRLPVALIRSANSAFQRMDADW